MMHTWQIGTLEATDTYNADSNLDWLNLEALSASSSGIHS